MNYLEAERWLFGRRRMGMKYGLQRMQALMAELGHPENQFETVHIVGTNGKGSTAAVLSSIAGELGFKWGRGTSPHLLHFRERIVVNDQWIPEDSVAQFITDNIHLFRKHSATFFEITSAMAAWYFAGQDVQWVAAEAGLGGRLDATRTYNGKATVFTGVRVEHSRILGDSREKIAAEKVAIAEPGSILIAAEQSPGVEEVLNRAVEAGNLKRLFPVAVQESPLPGKHQLENSALAFTAASELFGVSREDLNSAYSRTVHNLKWPGRLDHRAGSPSILFDVAHNPQSMQALVDYLADWEKPVPAVIGFLSDKPWEQMIDILRGVVGPVIATTPLSERRLEAKELGACMETKGFQVKCIDNIQEAVACCREIAGSSPMIVTGSFFTVGEAMNVAVESGWVSGVPDSAENVLD